MSLLGFLRSLGRHADLRIKESGDKYATFTAFCGDEECGFLNADLHPNEGMLKVAGVFVEYPYLRRGVATALYEAAAQKACRHGVRLTSMSRLDGAKSTDFWDKQVARGRAEKIFLPGQRDAVYLLKNCETSLSSLKGRARK